MNGRVLIGALLLLVTATARGGQETPAMPEIGIVEKPGEYLPLDAQVRDEHGYLVPLGSFIDKPTIITFVYFRCPGICSPLLTELQKVVEKMDLEIGTDYRIVTLSFDHRENAEMAQGKKDSYLASMRHPIPPEGWRFLTADSATIRRITGSAGFYFKRDGNDWIHAGALIIVSPGGKVTRYINGIKYLPFDVKLAIMEAAEGRVGPTIARLVSYCYSYDPEGKTYALNVTRIGLVVTLGLAAAFVVVFLLRPKKKQAERQS